MGRSKINVVHKFPGIRVEPLSLGLDLEEVEDELLELLDLLGANHPWLNAPFFAVGFVDSAPLTSLHHDLVLLGPDLDPLQEPVRNLGQLSMDNFVKHVSG